MEISENKLNELSTLDIFRRLEQSKNNISTWQYSYNGGITWCSADPEFAAMNMVEFNNPVRLV